MNDQVKAWLEELKTAPPGSRREYLKNMLFPYMYGLSGEELRKKLGLDELHPNTPR